MSIIDGSINVWIDEFVPCLWDTETNVLMDTAVFKVESRSYLQRFNAKNGWYIDWVRVPEDVDVYALVIQGTNEVQGLVSIKNDVAADVAFMHWACTAPHNNKHKYGVQMYSGVGGHLFAIAIDKSIQWGHGGAVYGFAANARLLQHYTDVFGAEFLGLRHRYHFWISEQQAARIKEVYCYEWDQSSSFFTWTGSAKRLF